MKIRNIWFRNMALKKNNHLDLGLGLVFSELSWTIANPAGEVSTLVWLDAGWGSCQLITNRKGQLGGGEGAIGDH